MSSFVASAGPTYDLSFGGRYEDNLARAEAAGDRTDDAGIVLASHVSGRVPVRTLGRLSWELGFSANWWSTYTDLGELAGDAALRYRQSLRPAFDAPWLEIVAAGSVMKFQDSDIRDGGRARAGVTLGQRLGARVDARIGYAYHLRRAFEERVFDLEQHEVFAELDLNLTQRLVFYTSARVREGELTSTAAVPNPKILNQANAVSRDFDRVFDDNETPARLRRTYQIDGAVTAGEAGINYLLARDLALDVAVEYFSADAAGDNHYHGYIVNASILWQFE
jgi:hypothetical protein